MSTTTVEKIESQINGLTAKDRAELLRRLTTPQPKNGESKKPAANGAKGIVNPNLAWIIENKAKYAGNYVALKDGKLIAFGRTIKEADQSAKAKGVSDPFLHYFLPADYVPWGGW